MATSVSKLIADFVYLESLWSNLSQNILACNPSDRTQISHFFSSLDREQKTLVLLEGPHLSFDQVTVTMVKRIVVSAVCKIHWLREEVFRELEAPWLPD